MPISDLISFFEKKGNINSQALCDEETSLFTDSDWKSFNEKEKEDILQKYRLAFLSETWVNWCKGLGTVLANDEIKDGSFRKRGFSSRTEINETVVS